MTFASDIEKFVTTAKENIDQVTRQAVVMAAQSVIMRSPVGNPELWKVNADAMYMRSPVNRATYNLFVDEANATRGEGEKKLRRLGKKRLKEGFKVKHSDYVGGRFRASWQFGVGAPNTATDDSVDPSGAATLEKFRSGVAGQKAGGVFFVTSSLSYAIPLEYGHSTQAPFGIVRLAMLELPTAIEQYAATLK